MFSIKRTYNTILRTVYYTWQVSETRPTVLIMDTSFVLVLTKSSCGEPACGLVLSVLSVLIMLFFFSYSYVSLVLFLLFVVLPVASPPGKVHDSDPMGVHDSDSPVGPGYNVYLHVSWFCDHRACISRISAGTGCAGCVCCLLYTSPSPRD